MKKDNNQIKLLAKAMDRLEKNIGQKNKWMKDNAFKKEFINREISSDGFNNTFNLLLISQLEVYFNEYSNVINSLDDRIVDLEKENKKLKKELNRIKKNININ